MSIRILKGDCRDLLKTLPDEAVHCVVTSPPYWGLRDYGTAKWEGGDPGCDHAKPITNYNRDFNARWGNGDGTAPQKQEIKSKQQYSVECPRCGARRIDMQIGLEPSFTDYIETMTAVFREVRRVLRKDGTLWLNMGDSYAGAVNGRSSHDTKILGRDDRTFRDKPFNTIGNGLKAKDVAGIPWRLAFALQAPQYLGRIHNETDRAWLAALMDGEGCITILRTTSPHGSGDSYPPVLSVRMCDREMIDKAMSLVGCNGDSPAQYPASMEGQRPAYQWRLHGRKAADTIAEIFPFLLIKRKQAVIAWNHQTIRDSYHTKRGVKIPADALEKQKVCCELIQRLNQKEQADLPSWMIEPPMPFGPGWYLRSDVIWAKPNPMPESVMDRPTKAHEYLFLMSKSERYYYDAEAIKEDVTGGSHPSGQNGRGQKLAAVGSGIKNNDDFGPAIRNASREDIPTSRNRRTVWEIATSPFPEAHFATFPPALVEPCILAGCPEKCCAKCGAPWVRETEVSYTNAGNGNTATLGFFPSCSCSAGTVPGIVLDPFGGAGTTGLVADRLGRNAILIELNPQYAEMAERRLQNDAGFFAKVAAE